MFDMREYHRRNYINTRKGRIKAVKRPRPDDCEFCGKEVSKLNYHHFEDLEPILGIWLCQSCHHFVENIDKAQHQVVVTQARIDGYYTFLDSLLDRYCGV